MKKIFVLTFLCVLCAGLVLTACQHKAESGTTGDAKEPSGTGSVFSGEMNPDNGITDDGKRTYVFAGDPVMMPEGWSYMNTVRPIYLEDDSTFQFLAFRVENDEMTRAVLTTDEVGSLLDSAIVPIPENGVMSAGTLDGENLVYACYEYDFAQRRSTGHVYQLDLQSGEVRSSGDLTRYFTPEEGAMFSVSALAVDLDGEVWAAAGEEVAVLNDELEFQFLLPVGGVVKSLRVSEDGEVLVGGMFGMWGARMLDKETRSVGAMLELPSLVSEVSFGKGFSLCFANASGVWGIPEDSRSPEMIMHYMNSGVDAKRTELLDVIDRDAVMLETRTTVGNDFTLFRRADDIDLSQTSIIELCYAKTPGARVTSAIVDYNRTHADSQINVRDYSVFDTDSDRSAGMTRMMTDIMSGLYAPDICIGYVDFLRPLAEKGLCTDLMPYLEDDPEIGTDNVFGAVRRLFDNGDGGMWGITSGFSVSTVAANRNLLGDAVDPENWSIEDRLAFIRNLPDEIVPIEYLHRGRADKLLLGPRGYGVFIHTESATCTFDSPLFRDYADFVVSLPENYAALRERSVFDARFPDERAETYHTGGIALSECTISRPEDYLKLKTLFLPDESVVVGYPDGADAIPSLTYVIPTWSEQKEGSWELVKDCLKMDTVEQFIEFPVLKSDFRKLTAELRNGYEFVFTFNDNRSDMIWKGSTKNLTEPGVVMELTDEDIENLSELLDGAGVPILETVPDNVKEIVDEELSALAGGIGTPEDCAKKIQSRVGIYLAEHK